MQNAIIGTPENDGDVFAAEVLAEQIENHGIVSQELMVHLGSAYERENSCAILYDWEISGDRSSYYSRKEFYKSQRQEGPTLDMDPAIAEAEIERLLRAPDPFEWRDRINELEIKVLKRAPTVFEKRTGAPPPVVTPDPDAIKKVADVEAGKPAAAALADVTATLDVAKANSLDARVLSFRNMAFADQIEAIRSERDTNVLSEIRRDNHFMPRIRGAAKRRMEQIESTAS